MCEIREAKREDAFKRVEYSKQIGSQTDNLSFGEEGFPTDEKGEADFIQSLHDDPHSISYFAWDDDRIIGDVTLTSFPGRMHHRAELGLTVLKEYWGKGIGSLLLQKAIKYAKENGIDIINLEVRSDNARAIHVYQKYGFQKIGVSPAYFKINDEYIDFDLMILDLRKQ